MAKKSASKNFLPLIVIFVLILMVVLLTLQFLNSSQNLIGRAGPANVPAGGLNSPCIPEKDNFPARCNWPFVCYNPYYHPNKAALIPPGRSDICLWNNDDLVNGLGKVCGQGPGTPCCPDDRNKFPNGSCNERVRNNAESCEIYTAENNDKKNDWEVSINGASNKIRNLVMNYNPWWYIFDFYGRSQSKGICVDGIPSSAYHCGELNGECCAGPWCESGMKCLSPQGFNYADKCSTPDQVNFRIDLSSVYRSEQKFFEGTSEDPVRLNDNKTMLIYPTHNLSNLYHDPLPLYLQIGCNYTDENTNDYLHHSITTQFTDPVSCQYDDVGSKKVSKTIALRWWFLTDDELKSKLYNSYESLPPTRPPDKIIPKTIYVYWLGPTPVK